MQQGIWKKAISLSSHPKLAPFLSWFGCVGLAGGTMLPGVGCRLTEQALSGRTLAWLSRPLQWWMIDVFFMEQQRFSKITQVNTFLLFSGLAVVVAGRGYTGVDRTTVINAARTIKPITQLFHSPGNLPRLSPHSCLLLSLPWPEGLQIHVSKQKQQENLQFKIFLSKIGTPWRNGEVMHCYAAP